VGKFSATRFFAQASPGPQVPSPERKLLSGRTSYWHAVAVCLIALACFSSGAHLSAQTPRKAPNAASFATLSAQADAARDADRLDEAIALYRRALALRPSWAEGLWSLATIYYDRDAYDNAALNFQKLIAQQPQNGTAYAMLGLCEFELKHDALALRHIQKGESLGLQKNPDLRQVVLYHEGMLLQRKGSFQAAQDTLEQLCLQAGPSDNAAATLGMTMLRMSFAKPPASGSPDYDVVMRVGRAECLVGQKKYDEARPVYDQIVKDYPDYVNVHYAYGLFLIELRDVAGSVEQFKQEIANHPDDLISRLRIAAVEYKQDSAVGIPYAEQAVRMAPQQAFGHYLLGLLRLDVDDYANAIPELEIAEKGMPKEAKIYLALGTAYSRAGRKQDANRARATFQRLNEEAQKSGGAKLPTEEDAARVPVGDAPSPQ